MTLRKLCWKRVWSLILAVALVTGMFPITAFAASTKVTVPEDRVYITSTQHAIVPGVKETVLTTNNTSGTEQRIGYMMSVDAGNFAEGNIEIVACYKDHAYDSFGLQTVTDQAAAYERDNPGTKVVAGINADFFNMNTGEPTGAFVMDGVVYHEANNRPYFAILKDGTATIRYDADLSDVYQAVGGDQILVLDGKVQEFVGDYANLKYSRAAIGIRADGSVLTYVTHGISAPTSCGESYSDLAAMFVAQGCVIALNVDGGGSATYASVREGTDELKVQNNPSDGTPRTVSTTLLVVCTASSDGQFHHASLTPNNEYYTPTANAAFPTKVQFEAVGVDASGASCDLPETGLTWALAESSKNAGSIDPETGVFTAALNYIGAVAVELRYNGEVVGTTEIQIVEPEQISFSGTGISMNFSEITDLGLSVKGAGVILNHKVGDFTWNVDCTTEGVDDSLFGTVSGNTFTSGAKQNFSMEGTVTASYTKADGTVLSTKILVEVGKMPIVALDFEDISGPRGKNVVGLWNWGSRANQFSDGTPDQVYKFQDYEILYYLQSTTYSSDSQWIKEIYSTTQPWVENEDGTVTVSGRDGNTYTGTKEATYGVHGEKWVTFTDDKGDGYYWRGFIEGDTWTGSFNAGGGAASTFLAADSYLMYAWHNAANLSVINDLQGAGSQIVDATEGEVRFGDHSLKLTYDFTRFSPTGGSKNTSIYYRVTKPLVAQGSPSGLGMWFYAPEGMSNYWLWASVSFWNGTQWKNQTLHYKPAGAEKTCQYTGINWTGWSYVELDLTPLYDTYGAVVDAEHPIQVRSGNAPIQITYIPGGTSDGEGNAIVCGSKSEGHFYVDDIRWVYGTNVDDMNAPVIMGASANGTALSADKEIELNSNNVSFAVDFTDPQGENFSGIDVTATQLYLDGAVLPTTQFSASADRAQTVDISLANGNHTLEVHISDNFGNKTSQIYHFVVNNPETAIPVITIDRPEAAELGGDYKVTISADKLANIASVSTNITYGNTAKLDVVEKVLQGNLFYDDYGNELTQQEDGKYYDQNGAVVEDPLRYAGTVKFSSAVQTLGENLTGSVRNRMATSTTRAFVANATVKENPSEDTTLLTFSLPIPSTFTEVDKVPVTITVTFTTTDGNSYTVSSGKLNNAVEAYYDLSHGMQVSGAESGTLTVTTKDDAIIDTTNLQVFVDGVAIDGTWDGNVFTTSYFTGLAANSTLKNVYVGDAVNKHYSFLHTVDVCGSAPEGAFSVTLNATSGDTTTMQQITWMSGLGSVPQNIQLQYMTKAEYEAANGDFTNATVVTATSVPTDFVLGGVDYVAAYINNVTLSDLTPGTAYVCRASDGNDHWSNVVNFKTEDVGETTDFVVIGDAQLHGDDTADANAIAALKSLAALNKNVDFGVQTGDFVDGGTNFTQWEQILRQFGNAFDGIDFVHTMGNHEAYTSNGTPATIITTRLFGLTDAQTKFYSVEYGDVYIAVINQAATANLNEAAEWLIEDAAKTDCTWKVMVTHQPVYYTNPNGSSQGHNQILAPACDAAGIDFVFGGHDHAYARTEQMLAGKPVDLEINSDSNAYVDANGFVAPTQGQGTVYFICGSMDPGGEYAVDDNPDFHFAKATNEYNGMYLTIEANDGKFTVNAYDMNKNGNATLIDTYTMYNGTGICDEAQSHMITDGAAVYDAEAKMLVCERCGAHIDPAELGYTGYAVDVNGVDTYGDSQYYFLAGNIRTGWFAMGENFVYANEDGLIDHAVENYSTHTCTENGKHMANSPRYDLTYTGGIARYTGHSYDENRVCATCGHEAIDVAGWNFSLSYTSTTYNGKAKTPAINIVNPANGEKLEFHTDGTGIMTDYARTWSNNKNVGTASVTIEMNPNGDYFNSNGAVTLELEIRPALPTNVTAVAGDVGQINVSWEASKSADEYVVYYSTNGKNWENYGTTAETSMLIENVNANSTYFVRIRARATVDGKTYNSLKYTDAVEVQTVAGYDLSLGSVKQSWTKTTFNGGAKTYSKTSLKVYNADGELLTRNTDYKVTYQNNVNVGTATIVITGTGVYEGTLTASFTITPLSLTGSAVVTAADAIYAGENTTTTVTVQDKNGRTLIEGTDYTLAYENNQSVGGATVTVYGEGNYTGSAQTTFIISEKDIADLSAKIDENAQLTYTGSAIAPAIVIEGLEAGVDYTVAYENNVNVGEAVAVVTGIDNYTGTLHVSFTIVPASIETATVTDGATYSYTGEEIKAVINVLSEYGAALVENVDFEVVAYANNVNAGMASVTIKGIGNYTGELTHNYEIMEAEIETFSVELEPDTFVYDGLEKIPVVHVVNTNGVELVKDVDYTIDMTNNVNVGNAVVTVTGIGNYTGEIVKLFAITAVDVEDCNVVLTYNTTMYSGTYKTPDVVVEDPNGEELIAGTDYEVAYANNKNAGTATVTVTGIGNYTGVVSRNFTIKHADLTQCTVTVNKLSIRETGDPLEPGVVVKTAKGTKLVEGLNYTVAYTNNVEPGTATVTVSGIGNYTGTLSAEFTITARRDIAEENFTATLKYTIMNYTGAERTPAVSLKTPSGTVLKNGTNYTVTYSDNVEVGTATVTITGIGKYKGTITLTFKIRPQKVTTLNVVSSTANSITVNFQTVESADKYYIYVNGEYYACTKTKTTYKIKGLESGKTYTIYIKAVAEVDGKNYYSSVGNKVTATTK